MTEETDVQFSIKTHLSLPEVIVLSMNMHGIIEIPGFPNLERMKTLKSGDSIVDLLKPIFTDQIPENMTLIKMSATSLGVPNYQRVDEAIKYNQIIMDTLEKYPLIKSGIEKNLSICEKFVREVASLIKEAYIKDHITHCDDTSRVSKSCLQKYFDGHQEDLHIREAFIQQLLSPYSYNTKVYHSGDVYTDKAFTRETKDSRTFEKKYSKDLECSILNKYGQKDLIGLLSPDLKLTDESQVEDDHYLHLSNIIHMLKHYGVKTILLFDLTCSVLADKNTRHYLGNEFPKKQNIYTIEDLESRLLTDNPQHFPGGRKISKKKYIRNKKFSNRIKKIRG
jgi:hypothetical protein